VRKYTNLTWKCTASSEVSDECGGPLYKLLTSWQVGSVVRSSRLQCVPHVLSIEARVLPRIPRLALVSESHKQHHSCSSADGSDSADIAVSAAGGCAWAVLEVSAVVGDGGRLIRGLLHNCECDAYLSWCSAGATSSM
jgi:hypothetical protein